MPSLHMKRFKPRALLCVRSDNSAVRSVSGLFGPTYSPTHDALYMATSRVGSSTGVTILEIDKGVAKADLCKQAPVITNLIGEHEPYPGVNRFN